MLTSKKLTIYTNRFPVAVPFSKSSVFFLFLVVISFRVVVTLWAYTIVPVPSVGVGSGKGVKSAGKGGITSRLV